MSRPVLFCVVTSCPVLLFPVVVVIGAVVVAALAWFAYDSLSQAPAPPEAAAGRAKQQKPPKGRKGKELTPHELRQQGQRVRRCEVRRGEAG